jgi:transcription-repair coupling factor (superfamily II helicase)
MSVINTPPKDRLPVYTEILPFNEELIAEAILREVDRGGQAFFVHNRVQSIDTMAEFLRELLPQVRFAIGHGQMPERALEKVMIDFLNKKYDCLIATMIVESGLDIPNVNTILINRADRFGLAQLYQLRGRVGRSPRRAFAYLLTPPWRALSKTAKRRLRAIEEFSDLGSGFKVAMRDLEIRGAGNILGPEQHGFVMDVGFDLYCQLLEEAVAELKGEKEAQAPAVEPELEIRVSAFIPNKYVPDVAQKMSIYQRLAEARKSLDIWEIEEEVKDRYGRLPVETQALFLSTYLRLFAQQLGVATLSFDDYCVRIAFPTDRTFTRKDIEQWVKASPSPLEFSFREGVAIEIKLEGNDQMERLSAAKNALQHLL